MCYSKYLNRKDQEDIHPVIVPNCACMPILILLTYCLLFRLESYSKESLKSVNSCTELMDLAGRVNFISNTIHKFLMKNVLKLKRSVSFRGLRPGICPIQIHWRALQCPQAHSCMQSLVTSGRWEV